ncbi:hypothetical protein BDQ17DRAFT_1042616 [Cyathus striatus]|nr:hypothetical protein BDQ17DRAFT_1042616 [Cyathus striatus]
MHAPRAISVTCFLWIVSKGLKQQIDMRQRRPQLDGVAKILQCCGESRTLSLYRMFKMQYISEQITYLYQLERQLINHMRK